MPAVVTFERLGRNHSVPPLTVDSADPDVIAEAVYREARKHLVSRDVEVEVDLTAGQVFVFAGFRNGGGGRVEVTE
jgi:hypothetical protein